MLLKILDFLLAPTCTLCGLLSDQKINLCRGCENDLPWLQHACPRCALPLTTSEEVLCGECLQKTPPFNRTIALFQYQQPIIHMITALKFQEQLVFSKLLGQLLLVKLQKFYQNKSWPECIIPMPLHKDRIKERGFNQALEIARPIHEITKIPLNRVDCLRIKATERQTYLAAKIRQINMRKAFIVKRKPGSHIAIIDDVITTGQTVHELSLALKRSGVAHIDIWCAARTLKSDGAITSGTVFSDALC